MQEISKDKQKEKAWNRIQAPCNRVSKNKRHRQKRKLVQKKWRVPWLYVQSSFHKTPDWIPKHRAKSQNKSKQKIIIKILIDNEELRDKFGKSGREWVSQNFEWNQGIQQFAQLFLELRPSNTNDTNENTNDTNK